MYSALIEDLVLDPPPPAREEPLKPPWVELLFAIEESGDEALKNEFQFALEIEDEQIVHVAPVRAAARKKPIAPRLRRPRALHPDRARTVVRRVG